MRSLRLLDVVQRVDELERFSVAEFSSSLDEVLALGHDSFEAVAQKLDALRDVLDGVERFTQKAMAIRLNHLSDEPLPQQLRQLLKATVTSYAGKRRLLEERVAAAMGRIEPQSAAAMTQKILAACDDVLVRHEALRSATLAMAARIAGSLVAVVQAGARDRMLPDLDRQRWGQARVDLEAVAARPGLVEVAPFADRCKQIPPPDAEPDTEPEPTQSRFSLLEID